MPERSSEIRAACTDARLNALLAAAPGASAVFTRHFNEVEEFFLRTAGELSVPELPIHHDVRRPEPERDYLERLREVAAQVLSLAPELLAGLTWFFDPAETLRPAFFRLYRIAGRQYLYLLRLDLTFRPQSQRALGRGSPGRAPAYATRELYLEPLVIPLRGVEPDSRRGQRFLVDQPLTGTWVGEVGRGYQEQGVWLDNELSRFFSRLLLPEGRRTYPYLPYLCRYQTLCLHVIRFGAEERRRALPRFHQAFAFLRPHLSPVEAALKAASSGEADRLFRSLKEKVPADWYLPWESLRVEAYLDGRDMKEYRIEDAPG